MSDCSKHKKELFGESDMAKVAEAIGDLHYQTLAELLAHLADKLHADARKDAERGRKLLSEQLDDAAYVIAQAGDYIKDAYLICAPFMNDKTTKDNE